MAVGPTTYGALPNVECWGYGIRRPWSQDQLLFRRPWLVATWMRCPKTEWRVATTELEMSNWPNLAFPGIWILL